MSTTDALVGATLGPCRLEALVGAGGMGRVYRARHLVLDRVVAVKLVDDRVGAGTPARAAVLAEARAAAKLDDPRVVAVYDVGEDQGRAFIVMQWVEGETLEARVRRAGPLAADEALRVMKETAAALAVAHAAGLVHRDVKPANILIDAKGGVKLTDFGLAGSAGSTGDGVTVGSFHFMAPEQGFGVAPHQSADLYALGATWFFALAGRPPFKGTGAEVMILHREEPPPDIRQYRPDATVRAANLLVRLMAKDPAARPASAAEVLREMANPSMLLETDETGSPFRILPPPTPEVRPGDDPARPAPTGSFGSAPTGGLGGPAAPAPGVGTFPAPAAPAFAPPPPPPAAPEAALGSRKTFFALFGVLAA
ncbi:MAG: serine/threonine protein kinase, partial [Elusimicrobia bacterium]|nr:serine/threonine protein kinase [Elusimicrobiota bacterium]